MTYSVKEIFFTLQGEGANTGKAAVFCRFTGCNLWSGREQDRTNAVCNFCDTNFVGTDGPSGGRYNLPEDLADAIDLSWRPSMLTEKFVVLTGGEPLLQVDAPLLEELHARGFFIAAETNGTVDPPEGLDWICVSPKANAPLRVCKGDEIKVVLPQSDINLADLESLPFKHRFVQPMDGPAREANTRLAVDWCLRNPLWRLSLQTHKTLGIP